MLVVRARWTGFVNLFLINTHHPLDALSGPSASKDVEEGEWIGLISGLDLGSPSPSDAQIQMLVEYLTSEVGGHSDQRLSSRISRLIIAGNSFTPGGVPLPVNAVEIVEKKPVRRMFLFKN